MKHLQVQSWQSPGSATLLVVLQHKAKANDHKNYWSSVEYRRRECMAGLSSHE
jgi:hypothetical protein